MDQRLNCRTEEEAMIEVQPTTIKNAALLIKNNPDDLRDWVSDRADLPSMPKRKKASE
jgi:hypothetical protein